MEKILGEWTFAQETELLCPLCKEKIRTFSLTVLQIDGKYFVELGCYKCGKKERKEITKEQAEKFVRHK